jgi:hypothetical protein
MTIALRRKQDINPQLFERLSKYFCGTFYFQLLDLAMEIREANLNFPAV